MTLWNQWWSLAASFRPAFSRERSFLWFASALCAFTIRPDLFGVTSFIRALGFKERYYDCLLAFFHSPAVALDVLARLWLKLLLAHLPGLVRVNSRPTIIGDGLKYPKSGKRMPSVKRLHQQSESNTKPQFIMGHSFQALGLLCRANKSFLCLPLIARIHEGLVFSNRESRTLLDKFVALFLCLVADEGPFNLVVDAYYASGKVIKPLIAKGHHLITRVRSNSVAYHPAKAPKRKRRGRPRKYGRKTKLKALFKSKKMQQMKSPVYGEENLTISFRQIDLLWRPVGSLVRFVLVDHPSRGRIMLMSTDISMSSRDIIALYGFRFKIEVSFKQAIHTFGTYRYHFWMARMTPLKRNAGNQHLHRKDQHYRDMVQRKMRAYHCYVQTGIIAQGLVQFLCVANPDSIWKHFGSWLRTIRPGLCPTEHVATVALKNTFVEFLADCHDNHILKKFIFARLDLERPEGNRLVA